MTPPRRGGLRARRRAAAAPSTPGAALALGSLVLTTMVAGLAVGFMLPGRPRLREPNDVHHSFRADQSSAPVAAAPAANAAAAAAPHSRLLQSTLPPLALGAAALTATAASSEEEAACLAAAAPATFEEELFSMDKAAELDSILDAPDLSVVEEIGAASEAAFVALGDITHEGRVITQRGVETEGQGRSQRSAAPLLQEVAAHLVGQARQAFLQLRRQLLAYVDGLVSQVQRLLGPPSRKLGDRLRNNYDGVRTAAAHAYGEVKAQALATADKAMAELRRLEAECALRVAQLKAAARARLDAWRGVASDRWAEFQATLEQDERYAALKAHGGRAAARAQAAAGRARSGVARALVRGRELATTVRARQQQLLVGGWGLKGLRLPRRPGAAGAAASVTTATGRRVTPVFATKGGAGGAGMDIGGSSSSGGGLESVAEEVQTPPFSLAYAAADGAGGFARGASSAYSALLAFDDDDDLFFDPFPVRGDDVGARGSSGSGVTMAASPEEEPASAESAVSMPDARAMGAVVSLLDEPSVEESQAQAQVDVATGGPPSDEDEEDDDDGGDGGSSDGGYDGLGLVSPRVAVDAADAEEEMYLSGSGTNEEEQQQQEQESSESIEAAAAFAGQPLSAAERARALGLREELRASGLPAAATAWVEEADFLRYAREFDDVASAWAALRRTCEFRAVEDVEGLMRSVDFSASPLSKELFWWGADKEGDPVLVFRTALHAPGKLPTEEYVRFMVYLLETGRRRFGLGKGKRITLLVDRKDAGFKQQDPLLIMKIVPLVQAHFPGYLKVTYVAPSNWIFTGLWKLFGLVLAPSTVQRVQLLSPGAGMAAALGQQFPPSILPEYLGGTLQSYEDKNTDVNGTSARAGVAAAAFAA